MLRYLTTIVLFLSFHLSYSQVANTYQFDKAEKTEQAPTVLNLLDTTIARLITEIKNTSTTVTTLTGYAKLESDFNEKARVLNREITGLYERKRDTLSAKLDSAFSAEQIAEYRSNLAKLETKRKTEMLIVREFETLAAEMKYRKRTSGRLTLFPVRNSVDAQLFYNNEVNDDRRRFLKNTNLSFSPGGGKASIFNELFADYAEFVRVGVGVLITNKQASPDINDPEEKEESEKDAVQRLLGGGGNFSLNLSTPLVNFDSDILSNEQFSGKFIFAPRLSLDVPKLGTESSDYAVNLNTGFEGSIFYSLAEAKITFFSDFRFGYVLGNGHFYRNIANDNSQAFMFNHVSVGIALSSTFRLHWTHYYGSSFVKSNFPSAIGFSVVPN